MDELTWTCHVCKEERPDDKISVFTRSRMLVGGVKMDVNIRHCNDKDSCIEGAQDVHFVNEKFREPTPEDLEQYEQDTNPSKDASGSEKMIVAGIGIAILIAVVAIVYGISKAVPAVSGWFDKDATVAVCEELDADATFAFCTDRGFIPSGLEESAPYNDLSGDEQWCVNNGWHRGDALVETCDSYCAATIGDGDTCATLRYELPEGVNPGTVTEYLTDANEVIDQMLNVKTEMETLEDLTKTFGSSDNQQMAAFNDKQWLRVYNNILVDMTVIRHKLQGMWAPSPYNSSNPLLDAHGRLLQAFLYLDESRSDIEYGFNEKEPWYITNSYEMTFDEFAAVISYVRIGLGLAR